MRKYQMIAAGAIFLPEEKRRVERVRTPCEQHAGIMRVQLFACLNVLALSCPTGVRRIACIMEPHTLHSCAYPTLAPLRSLATSCYRSAPVWPQAALCSVSRRPRPEHASCDWLCSRLRIRCRPLVSLCCHRQNSVLSLQRHQASQLSTGQKQSNYPVISVLGASLLLCLCAVVISPGAAEAVQSAAQLDLAAELSPKTAGLLALVARPVLSAGIFLMLVRIVLSWYPNVRGDKLPWSAAVYPTEFFLGPTRRALPPVGGVDIAPVRH